MWERQVQHWTYLYCQKASYGGCDGVCLSIPRPDLHIGLGVLSILQSDSPLQLSRETVVGSPERKPTTRIALGRETRLRSLWKSRTVADRLSPRELALCL